MKVLPQRLPMREKSQIVADGRKRVLVDDALIAKIRAEVEREYQQESCKARTTWQR